MTIRWFDNHCHIHGLDDAATDVVEAARADGFAVTALDYADAPVAQVVEDQVPMAIELSNRSMFIQQSTSLSLA